MAASRILSPFPPRRMRVFDDGFDEVMQVLKLSNRWRRICELTVKIAAYQTFKQIVKRQVEKRFADAASQLKREMSRKIIFRNVGGYVQY
jgi:hypothetical protein